MIRTRILPLCGIAMLMAACGQSGGDPISANVTTNVSQQNQKEFGDYVVHFNAVNSDQISSEAAAAYNISRSKGRALLTISITRSQPGSSPIPVHGSVEASAKNLTGQLKTINMREIVDGKAIYYVGELTVANAETLIFDITAMTDGFSGPMNIRYQNQFYTD